jgi:methylase of polypeptide subunit release factors
MKRYLLTFLAVCCSGVVTWAQTPARPDVVIVMTDDHSAAHARAHDNSDIVGGTEISGNEP